MVEINENIGFILVFCELFGNITFADTPGAVNHYCGFTLPFLFPLKQLVINFSSHSDSLFSRFPKIKNAIFARFRDFEAAKFARFRKIIDEKRGFSSFFDLLQIGPGFAGFVVDIERNIENFARFAHFFGAFFCDTEPVFGYFDDEFVVDL